MAQVPEHVFEELESAIANASSFGEAETASAEVLDLYSRQPWVRCLADRRESLLAMRKIVNTGAQEEG